MSEADLRLIRAVRRGLRAVADPDKAAGMQAYMKSAMPYLGVQTPVLRRTLRPLFEKHPQDGFDAWRDTVLALWRKAAYREERYAAMELTGHPLYRDHQKMKALPLYEEMIITGAWWDYVDMIASHRLGGLLANHPAPMRKKMIAWARGRDLWKRRSAILCQLGFKRDTDLELLHACIEPSMGSDEFFLRKGIGWALRQLAWSDPDTVIRYVKRHGNRLSPLSKREALKNLLNKGLVESIP